MAELEMSGSLLVIKQEVERQSQSRRALIGVFSSLPLIGIGGVDPENLDRASRLHAIRAIMRPGIFESLPEWNHKVAKNIADYLISNYKEGVIEWIGDTNRIDNFPPRDSALQIKAMWLNKIGVK